MPSETEVVKARETHRVCAVDPSGAALNRLVGPQERVDKPSYPQALETILESSTFRKAFPSDRLGLSHNRSIARIKHAGGHALDQIAAGDDVGEPLLAKPHPIAALEAMDGIEKSCCVDAA